MATLSCFLLAILVQLLDLPDQLNGEPFDYPSANLATTWVNSPDAPHTVNFSDGSTVTATLLRQSPPFFGPSFACGFYCGGRNPCNNYLFAVFILYTNSGGRITQPVTGIPQVVWSANRNTPVKENATLELTKNGDLVLNDADGKLVWSTNTAGKSVEGMNLTESGNLVLFDATNAVVWQSFDHPTDALVSGQRLAKAQMLIANSSASNWTQSRLYISSSSSGSFAAYVSSNPPQLYYEFNHDAMPIGSTSRQMPCFLRVTSETLTFFANSSSYSVNATLARPPPSTVQFLRLESDGHMKLYEWDLGKGGWFPTEDVFTPYLGECAFPTSCGSYGICNNRQCSCPSNGSSHYFTSVDSSQPNDGCSAIYPLSCTSSKQHQFLQLQGISYFNYIDASLLYPNVTTPESCKETCLSNCSCKAALFQYGSNASDGSCFLPQEIFSLIENRPTISHYNSTAYLKVQVPLTSSPPSANGSPSTPSTSPSRVGIIVGVVFGTLFIAGVVLVLYRKTRARREEMEEEEEFVHLPGMPTRYSYGYLTTATENFTKKLGGGGFGSVFDGTLVDGTRVAVKQLQSLSQGKREFLAEVETIGSIHHLNLVRLMGFCAEKSHRLLVYEHMFNGSLDKWIFGSKEDNKLCWEMMRRIIYQVAKGLSYLHEECRQKIAHLDIKPENILLDSDFNAKVSDFGLAKLIDRDQSVVVTMMRGTPGYLAPEWLTSMITEKVDVYSFGIVVAEIVCGRRNVDRSQCEEHIFLLPLLREKAIAGQLLDVIDDHMRNVPHNDDEELVKMLKLAIWCLQYDPNKRPTMSMVMKVLEGGMDVIDNLDYDFTSPVSKFDNKLADSGSSTPLLASILSGPR